jgi:uncharacterized protein YceH (UPF0502 family)
MINFELGILTPIQIRILGTLIEKSLTTPEYYPLSLNSLTTGCNQKSSRKPVTDYTESEINEACNQLKVLNFVSLAVGGGSRTIKFKHNFINLFDFNTSEIAILALLFLRGPLTAGELNSNSGRMHEFADLESVQLTLQKLSSYEKPLVKLIDKKPGQKEARYIHLFSEFFEEDLNEENIDLKTKYFDSNLEHRINLLEHEVDELKQIVNQLKGLL